MQSSQSNSDEIDLLHLLANLTRFLLRNWLIIVLSIGSCVALSWLSYRRAPKTYGSEMIIQSQFLTENYSSQVVKVLQKIVSEADDSLLASKLNLTKAEASLVKSVAVNTPFSERVTLPEEARIVFLLSVEVSDPSVLPKLQSGLVYFFENLEFVKSRVTERRKSYQNLIARIGYEMGHADSLPATANTETLYPILLPDKKISNRKYAKDEQMPDLAILDPVLMSVYLTKEKNLAKEELAVLHNGVEVMHGFAPSGGPVSPVFSIYMASGFSSGILLSLLLLGLRSVQWLFKKYPA